MSSRSAWDAQQDSIAKTNKANMADGKMALWIKAHATKLDNL